MICTAKPSLQRNHFVVVVVEFDDESMNEVIKNIQLFKGQRVFIHQCLLNDCP